MAGEVPQAILAGDYERAKAAALWYRDLFGEGNYYIELQDHGLEEDNTVLPQLIKLARETGIPMAATNDSHYLRKEDAKMQGILLCIQTGKTIQDADKMEFQTDEFYVKTTDEMYELFSMVPEACENTAKIAEQCNFDFDFGHTKIPYYKAPNGMDNQAFLKSSAGKVWSAATAPMFRRPTKTVWNTRSAWSKRWATRTTILSCGTT